jgi:uncharacterized DUF497 family protein
MTANNAFERTVRHRGPRLAAAQRLWPSVGERRFITLRIISARLAGASERKRYET